MTLHQNILKFLDCAHYKGSYNDKSVLCGKISRFIRCDRPSIVLYNRSIIIFMNHRNKIVERIFLTQSSETHPSFCCYLDMQGVIEISLDDHTKLLQLDKHSDSHHYKKRVVQTSSDYDVGFDLMAPYTKPGSLQDVIVSSFIFNSD